MLIQVKQHFEKNRYKTYGSPVGLFTVGNKNTVAVTTKVQDTDADWSICNEVYNYNFNIDIITTYSCMKILISCRLACLK